MSTVAELTDFINAKGAESRDWKAAKASKEEIMPKVTELLQLKERYKEANGGVPFDPPKDDSKKKKKKEEVPPPSKPTSEGPSKKELNKLAKKEKRKTAVAEVKAGVRDAASNDTSASANASTAASSLGCIMGRGVVFNMFYMFCRVIPHPQDLSA